MVACGAYLSSHVRYFVFSRLDLALQFFDFVVQHELELLQLGVFLLQLVDSLVLFAHCFFALTNLA
jgi:hypothetical protein